MKLRKSVVLATLFLACSSIAYAKSQVQEGTTDNFLHFRDERGKTHITTTVSEGDDLRPFFLHRWFDLDNDNAFNNEDYRQECFYFSSDEAIKEAGRKKVRDCATTKATGVSIASDSSSLRDAYLRASTECRQEARVGSALESQAPIRFCIERKLDYMQEEVEREQRWAEERAEKLREKNPLASDPIADAYKSTLAEIASSVEDGR